MRSEEKLPATHNFSPMFDGNRLTQHVLTDNQSFTRICWGFVTSKQSINTARATSSHCIISLLEDRANGLAFPSELSPGLLWLFASITCEVKQGIAECGTTHITEEQTSLKTGQDGRGGRGEFGHTSVTSDLFQKTECEIVHGPICITKKYYR